MGLFISDRGRGLVKNRRWPAMRELETAREHGQKRSPLPRTTAPRAPAPKCTSRVCYLALSSSSSSASAPPRRRLPLRRARRRRSSRALINDRSAYLFVTLAYLTTLSALIFPRRRFPRRPGEPSHANTVINVSCAAAALVRGFFSSEARHRFTVSQGARAERRGPPRILRNSNGAPAD